MTENREQASALSESGTRQTWSRRARGSRIALQAFGALTVLPASLLVALFLALVLYQIVFFDRVCIGVHALGTDLGGMTRHQAYATLTAQADTYLNYPVALQYQDRSWTVAARQVGATLDVPLMISQAYAVGHAGDVLSNLPQQLRALSSGMEVETAVRYDTGPANVLLTQIAQLIDRTARDAQLIIQPDLSILAVQAQAGLAVDIGATLTAVHQRALARDASPVNLVVRETQPAVTEVEPARQLAEALLGEPLTLTFATPDRTFDWSLSPVELASMLMVREEIEPAGTGRVRIAFDVAQWSAYLDNLAAKVERPSTDARFAIDPTSGTLTVLQPSQPGIDLDVPQALARIATLLVQPAHRIELPVRSTAAAVAMELADQMGFTDVVAEATSSFRGSSDARMRNIQVAASKFHGLVMPPGSVFSFNEYLGPVTAENGFEDSLIIWGDRTAVGIGGGVCQVSTTAFRAAFFGGFEIIERWAHGYRVSWYEIDTGPGLDATIYAPDVDFKFRNDTENFLLIQTYTDSAAATVTFRFYGTPTQRQVVVEGPLVENVTSPQPPQYQNDPSLPAGTKKQVEWARGGADVTVKRTVTRDGVTIHQDTFVSHYSPWRELYLVGTGNTGVPAGKETAG